MASTYLTRTFQSGGNRKKWTYSVWFKRSRISASSGDNMLFQSYVSTYTYCPLQTDDTLRFQDGSGGNKRTHMKFRDCNAWYHLVVAIDTDLSTAGDRYKIYVNGTRLTDADFETNTNPSQGYEGEWNKAQLMNIGRHSAGESYFDGLMSHIHFCDGYQYQASDFGETDATTGEWKIKTSPNVSYGTTGFFILKDGNTVTDSSSNSNTWTVGAGTLTKTEDNPSNVFATFNPLARSTNSHYANGNTTYDYANNYQKTTSSTLATNNKKIYAEFKILRSTTIHLGIVGDTFISDGRTVNDTGASWSYDMRGHTGAIALQTASGTGSIYVDGSYSSTNVDFTTTTNDIVMIAFDPTTKKIWWGKNGTWSSSGNPATGANASYTYSGTATSDFCFAVASEGSSAGAISANFGNGYFGTTAVSSAGANASGIGIFEYDVPANFTALSTKGLNL